MRQLIIYWICFLLFFSCEPKNNNSEQNNTKQNQSTSEKASGLSYDLSHPYKKYSLPNKLAEISGLSYYSENKLLCVNDEIGKIYLYDLALEEIVKSIDFGKEGDYEGVELVGNTAYILNSSGKIKAINLDTENTKNIDCTRKEVAEYEGLGYNVASNSLLLAAKEMKGDKKIYAYSLNDESLVPKYLIPNNEVEKNSEGKEFKPSGIAVNPISNEIYVLASAGKKLMVLSENGEKVRQYNLEKELYKQPEGICFAPNGTLYISSEGVGGKAYIFMIIVQKSIL